MSAKIKWRDDSSLVCLFALKKICVDIGENKLFESNAFDTQTNETMRSQFPRLELRIMWSNSLGHISCFCWCCCGRRCRHRYHHQHCNITNHFNYSIFFAHSLRMRMGVMHLRFNHSVMWFITTFRSTSNQFRKNQYIYIM